MEDRKTRSLLKRIEKIRTWQLIVIFILLLAISATFLRLNNVGMVERRNAVISADESGDPEAIRLRLADLQTYVSRHMNTNLSGGVLLTVTMKRDQQSIVNTSNINVYKQADEKCRANLAYSVYFSCMTNYLNSIPGGQVVSQSLFSADKVQLIYTHNYISPVWSPDFAGWSILLALLVLILIIMRLVSVAYLHWILRRHRNLI